MSSGFHILSDRKRGKSAGGAALFLSLILHVLLLLLFSAFPPPLFESGAAAGGGAGETADGALLSLAVRTAPASPGKGEGGSPGESVAAHDYKSAGAFAGAPAPAPEAAPASDVPDAPPEPVKLTEKKVSARAVSGREAAGSAGGDASGEGPDGAVMESRGMTESPGGTERAGRNTPSFEKAKPVSEINPSYPPAAVRGRLEGKVLLEAQIDSSGKAVSVKVFSSSGHTLLDRAALKSVRQARFLPAVYLGKNVSDILTISVDFSLKE